MLPRKTIGPPPKSCPATSHAPSQETAVADIPFELLDRHVISPLIRDAAPSSALRIWAPAAANSTVGVVIAAIAARRLAERSDSLSLQIFVTGSSQAEIAKAGRGEIPRPIARELLRLGFRAQLEWVHSRWCVEPAVRSLIMFSVHDTLIQAPFAGIDFVYAHQALVNLPLACNSCLGGKLLQAVRPNGLIYTGNRGHEDGARHGLTAVIGTVGLFSVTKQAAALMRERQGEKGISLLPGKPTVRQLEMTARALLPAAVIVNTEGNIQAEIGASASLVTSPKEAWHRSLSASLTHNFREPALQALVRVIRTGTGHWVSLHQDEGPSMHGWIAAEPMPQLDATADAEFLLRLVSNQDRPQAVQPATADLAILRAHLVHATSSLKRAMAAAEQRNRELLATNAELQATNAELVTAMSADGQTQVELAAVRGEHEEMRGQVAALRADLKNLQRSVDIGVVVLDCKLRVHRFTDAACQAISLTRRDLKRPFSDIEVPATLRPTTTQLEKVVKHAESFEWTAELEDGRTFLVRLLPFRSDRRRVTGALLNFFDVTELERSKKEMQQQNLALRRANEDLERFAYVASHDLKSPLRSVRTMLEFLRDDLTDQLTEDTSEHLDLVSRRVMQMEQMIQDLLTYSRLGRKPGDLVQVQIDELIGDQIALLDLPEAYSVDIRANGLTVLTYPTLLQHVIRNLAENAVTHHDHSSGKIEVEVTVVEANTLRFVVRDDGPGIPIRHQERVFEIFQKTNERSTGSGMGLALVKKAINRNGGDVTIESEDGRRGTAFSFTWPVYRILNGDAAAPT